MVNKLAAILRVADALDVSHTQSIRNIRVKLRDGQLVIETRQGGEFAGAKRALANKGEMFEQVYGRSVVLRPRRNRG